MEFELLDREAPLTVEHFSKLAEQGFYNELLFFQHLSGIFLKSGCPRNNGTGYPGYLLKSELMQLDTVHDRGVLSMVCGRNNTIGSQFIVCLERIEEFDRHHVCIGKLRIQGGWDVLYKLRRFDQILNIELGELDDSPEMEDQEDDLDFSDLDDL